MTSNDHVERWEEVVELASPRSAPRTFGRTQEHGRSDDAGPANTGPSLGSPNPRHPLEAEPGLSRGGAIVEEEWGWSEGPVVAGASPTPSRTGNEEVQGEDNMGRVHNPRNIPVSDEGFPFAEDLSPNQGQDQENRQLEPNRNQTAQADSDDVWPPKPANQPDQNEKETQTPKAEPDPDPPADAPAQETTAKTSYALISRLVNWRPPLPRPDWDFPRLGLQSIPTKTSLTSPRLPTFSLAPLDLSTLPIPRPLLPPLRVLFLASLGTFLYHAALERLPMLCIMVATHLVLATPFIFALGMLLDKTAQGPDLGWNKYEFSLERERAAGRRPRTRETSAPQHTAQTRPEGLVGKFDPPLDDQEDEELGKDERREAQRRRWRLISELSTAAVILAAIHACYYV